MQHDTSIWLIFRRVLVWWREYWYRFNKNTYYVHATTIPHLLLAELRALESAASTKLRAVNYIHCFLFLGFLHQHHFGKRGILIG